MKQFFKGLAVAMTAAVMLTACSSENNEETNSLIKTTFVGTTHNEGDTMESILSFSDDQNVVLRTKLTHTKPNGITMEATVDHKATYVAHDSQGTLHISEMTTTIGSFTNTLPSDKTWSFTYDLKAKNLVLDGVPLTQSQYQDLNFKEILTTSAAPITPTVENLQGSWTYWNMDGLKLTTASFFLEGNKYTIYLSAGGTYVESGTWTLDDKTIKLTDQKGYHSKITFSNMLDNQTLIDVVCSWGAKYDVMIWEPLE